jgi:hypothetical protein
MENKILAPFQKKKRTRASKPVAPALLLAIVDRGRAARVNELFVRNGVFFTTVMHGSGTASSEILDILGLEAAEKDILLSVTSRPTAIEVMAAISDRLSGFDCGKGIACRLNLTAAPNLLVQSLNLTAKKGAGVKMENKDKYSLIVISVAQGYADEVMAVAKKAGARGGTLIRAHQIESDQAEGLFAQGFTPERELLLIMTHQDKRNAIMESVNEDCGMKTKAGAIIMSLGIEEIAKLS